MNGKNNRVAAWINQILSEISQLDDNKGIDILNSCGKDCCERSDLYQGAVKIRNNKQSEKDIETLFNKFKEEFYSSGKITKTGNVISLIFEECTCPLVEKGVNNSFLCNCTTGYSKRLFEILFDREVSVKLEQSILKGDSICKQTIILK